MGRKEPIKQLNKHVATCINKKQGLIYKKEASNVNSEIFARV